MCFVSFSNLGVRQNQLKVVSLVRLELAWKKHISNSFRFLYTNTNSRGPNQFLVACTCLHVYVAPKIMQWKTIFRYYNVWNFFQLLNGCISWNLHGFSYNRSQDRICGLYFIRLQVCSQYVDAEALTSDLTNTKLQWSLVGKMLCTEICLDQSFFSCFKFLLLSRL